MSVLQEICIEPRQTVTCICCDQPRMGCDASPCMCDLSTKCLWCRRCFRHCPCVTLGRFLKANRYKINPPLMCHWVTRGRDKGCGRCEVCARERIAHIERRLGRMRRDIRYDERLERELYAQFAHEFSEVSSEPTFNEKENHRLRFY